MDVFIGALVVLLTMVMTIVPMLAKSFSKKHPGIWRWGLVALGLLICSLAVIQTYRHEAESRGWTNRADEAKHMLKAVQDELRATKQKLDESIQREQRINDQNNDFRTDLAAQSELLQIMKRSLPPAAQKQAEQIHKHWVREVYETVGVQDAATATKK